MTRKLQLLLTTLLLTIVGVTSAWAKIVWPDSLVQYKTTSAISEATNSWDTGYPKDGKTLAKIGADENFSPPASRCISTRREDFLRNKLHTFIKLLIIAWIIGIYCNFAENSE